MTTYARIDDQGQPIAWGFPSWRPIVPPEAFLGAAPSDEQLARWGVRRVADTAPPQVGYGKRADPGPPEDDGAGGLRQTWVVTETIDLVTAKADLRELAVQIYWVKVRIEYPTPRQVQQTNADPAALDLLRRDRFRPKLIDVRDRIQAAATIEEAEVILQELRGLQQDDPPA